MILTDVNILVFAVNTDAPDHERYEAWLEDLCQGADHYGVSEFVLSSVIRLMKNRRMFPREVSTQEALDYARMIRDQPNAVILQPGPRHWDIFVDLCERTGARNNTVPDAYLAALAIEHDCEWITDDRGFRKYPGLSWRHPFDE